MPEISRVYAAPEHGLVALLDPMTPDVRDSLIQAFDTKFGACWNKDLQRVLTELEGVFQATRYPFERGMNITRYNLAKLRGLADFLSRFVRSIPLTHRIELK